MGSPDVQVLVFGELRDIIGASQVSVSMPPASRIVDLLVVLETRFPRLSTHRERMACAVNAKWSDAATTLQPGDEVALLPPVSGG